MGSVRPSTSRVMPLCLSKYGDRSYCTYSSAISTSGSGVPVSSFKRFKCLEKKFFFFQNQLLGSRRAQEAKRRW